MWAGLIFLIIYMIARRNGWGIREWMEILAAGICLFFLFYGQGFWK